MKVTHSMPPRRLLSVALMLALAQPGLAQTQQAEPEATEEDEDKTTLDAVTVTGIRGSLTSSMNIKRDAQGVVDGIVAEDIGKFPDTNLAESLQRISGVSIDRVNGEGSRVTVRGVGPDFNLVLLNGRQVGLQFVRKGGHQVELGDTDATNGWTRPVLRTVMRISYAHPYPLGTDHATRL